MLYVGLVICLPYYHFDRTMDRKVMYFNEAEDTVADYLKWSKNLKFTLPNGTNIRLLKFQAWLLSILTSWIGLFWPIICKVFYSKSDWFLRMTRCDVDLFVLELTQQSEPELETVYSDYKNMIQLMV